MTPNGMCSKAVNRWVELAGSRLRAEQLIYAFDGVMGCLWRRAQATLGPITLIAIAESVLYDATRLHGLLKALTVDVGGISCKALLLEVHALSEVELLAGIHFFLLEFLNVVNSISGNVLAPALLAELNKHLQTDALL